MINALIQLLPTRKAYKRYVYTIELNQIVSFIIHLFEFIAPNSTIFHRTRLILTWALLK